MSEPIICKVDIVNPHKQAGLPWSGLLWFSYNPFQSQITLPKNPGNIVQNILYKSIFYKKINLPYRFSLICCEIAYKHQHIDSIRLSGVYLSGIDIPSGNPQLSVWKTPIPPITSIEDDELITDAHNGNKLEKNYFIAHWLNDRLHLFWSLKDNADILNNPSNYPERDWMVIQF